MIESRWFGPSMNPPVPGVEALRKVSGETSCALPVVATTCDRLAWCDRSRRGSTRTWSWRSRSPQIATLATPGSPISRGRIVHRARTESWIGVRRRERRPIIIARAVDDTGWSIWGGCATFGRTPVCASRSCTSWRSSRMLVPGAKTRSITESPEIESERIVSTPFTPFRSSCSIGTVMSCSTSGADSPRLSVWISTVGAPNSGRTSTGVPRSATIPAIATAAAPRMTRRRNLIAARTIA